jgi:hypothetical protein
MNAAGIVQGCVRKVWLRRFPEDHEQRIILRDESDSKVSSEICAFVSQLTGLLAASQGSHIAAQSHAMKTNEPCTDLVIWC